MRSTGVRSSNCCHGRRNVRDRLATQTQVITQQPK
jgi:hypothetical protein